MHRRSFLQAAGAAAAALSSTSLLSAALPQKNWRCLIGGNRSGKSTKAAKIVSEYDFIMAVSKDVPSHKYMNGVQYKLLNEVVRDKSIVDEIDFLRQCDVATLSPYILEDIAIGRISKFKRKALWADECPAYGLETIANAFDCVVFSSWPGDHIQGSPFYEECVRMGPVEHMRMRPECEHWMCRDEFSRDEWKRRIEGVFA